MIKLKLKINKTTYLFHVFDKNGKFLCKYFSNCNKKLQKGESVTLGNKIYTLADIKEEELL